MTNQDGRVALATEVFANPRELLAKLGAPHPIKRVTLPDGMPTVLVTGNREAREALSDPRLVRSVQAAAPELHKYHPMASDDYALSQHMLFADPPNHARMRRLVSKAFTRRRVEEMRPRIQQITDRLVDAIAPAGSADLIQALALPLPIAVISEMLGIPFEDRAEFEQHAETLTGINASSSFDDIIAAGRWFDKYLTDLVEGRRTKPGDDLVSAMLAAQVQDDKLTDLELRSNVLLLLSAGFETTVNLVANGILALLRHPDAMAVLRAEPELMPNAVEELLRYDSPVSCITYHFAREPVEIAGFQIQPGEHVVIASAAANHDPTIFDDPARLDLRRDTAGQVLSFSHGIHFCLGAPLARLEGEIAFGTVLRRLDSLRLAIPTESLNWKPSFVLHRLEKLPVTFTPAP
ncbi:cytochrome P450 [Phytohabitans flavus]|uniref:cytochrome P450 family protein n=1 Tax=Phytohabitans flavus TaxID=1076124 RepID=UPI0031EC3B89